jgi:hypothetical protein
MAVRRDLGLRGIAHNIMTNECSVISASRNQLSESFMNRVDADYLFWLDSDIEFPPYGLYRLISRDLDIVGGVYYRKEATARPLVMRLQEDNMFTTILDFPTDRVFECDGIGTGFLLIKRKVFEAFTPEAIKELGPPFGIGYGPTGMEEGEDLSFCRRAQKLGFKIWADPTVPLKHVGRFGYGREQFELAREFEKWKEKAHAYDNDIDGWMSRMELNWLLDTAKGMTSVVEVGSWKGRSTHALLTSGASVTAVDTWKGTKNELAGPHKEAKEHDILADDFLPNVGAFPNLTVWKMDSLSAAARLKDKSVDMVFLDGDHTTEAVRADIKAWLPKARKYICGHDWQLHSVQEAVTEVFGEPDTAGTIWLKKLEG